MTAGKATGASVQSDAMNISSRTPEGRPNRCPLCGKELYIEPSATRDAPGPHCGHLNWFAKSGVDPSGVDLIEQTRKHIDQLIKDIAGWSEQEVPPGEYFQLFLEKVQRALAAHAGAVWTLNRDGDLQLQFQINLRRTGIDASDTNRCRHAELLRHVITTGEPHLLPPRSDVTRDESGLNAGNPTDHLILLVPIVVDGQVQGIVEVFQDPTRNPNAHRGYLQFLAVVANLAARYLRNRKR